MIIKSNDLGYSGYLPVMNSSNSAIKKEIDNRVNLCSQSTLSQTLETSKCDKKSYKIIQNDHLVLDTSKPPIYRGIEGKWYTIEKVDNRLKVQRHIDLSNNVNITHIGREDYQRDDLLLGKQVAIFEIPEHCYEFPVTLWGQAILFSLDRPAEPLLLLHSFYQPKDGINYAPLAYSPSLSGSIYDLNWAGPIPKLDANHVIKSMKVREISAYGMSRQANTISSIKYEKEGDLFSIDLDNGLQVKCIRYPKDGPDVFCYQGQKACIMEIDSKASELSHLKGRFIFVTSDDPEHPILIEKTTINGLTFFIPSNDQDLLPNNSHFTPGFQPRDFIEVSDTEKEVPIIYDNEPAIRVIVEKRTLLEEDQIYRLSNGMVLEKPWFGNIWSLGQKLIIVTYPKGHPNQGISKIVTANNDGEPEGNPYQVLIYNNSYIQEF